MQVVDAHGANTPLRVGKSDGNASKDESHPAIAVAPIDGKSGLPEVARPGLAKALGRRLFRICRTVRLAFAHGPKEVALESPLGEAPPPDQYSLVEQGWNLESVAFDESRIGIDRLAAKVQAVLRCEIDGERVTLLTQGTIGFRVVDEFGRHALSIPRDRPTPGVGLGTDRALSAPQLVSYAPGGGMVSNMGRVVIVGGGFAGVEAARRLRKRLATGWEIVLYSRENHLCFSPMLPEVVGSSVDAHHVVWSIREMALGVLCRTAPVTGFDFDAKQVVHVDHLGNETRESYDHLVIAAGLPVRLEIIPGMGEFGWPIKTLGDAAALRNHLIAQLERAEVTEDPEERKALLSVAVVGGGFTGVEVAGAILDLFRDSARFYSRIGERDAQVHLIEGGPRILGPLSESLAKFAEAKMRRRGMQVRVGVSVEGVEVDGVRLGGDEKIVAGTVISAVGNGTHPFIAHSGLPMERGRLVVTGAMNFEERPEVWAIGDCAAVPNAHDGSISPTLAQFATRQARQVAGNIVSAIEGRPTQPFAYTPQGMFCLIGHRNAVGQIYSLRVSGFVAWMMWHAIYWAKMPSVARKVQIAGDWAWNLFFPRDIVELSSDQTRDIEAKHGKPL